MAKANPLEAMIDVLKGFNPYVAYLDQSVLSNVDNWIDTGSKMMNAIVSGSLYKGIPEGRVTLLAGESGVGKSLIAMKVAGNAQRMGKSVVVFDSENAIDTRSAKNLGVDPSNLIHFPVRSIEQTRNAVYKFLETIEEKKLDGKFLIIIDSLANMVSEIEEKRMGRDSTSADMGTIAKAIKSLLKTCTTFGGLTKTTFLVTNHIYDNPNEMYPDLVKCMPGGKACRYLPSIVVQMVKRNVKNDKNDFAKDEEDVALGKGVAGQEIRFLCPKNRFLRPLIEGSTFLNWKTGLVQEYGLDELAKDLGIVENRGSYFYKKDGTPLGQGKKWKENKELWDEYIYPAIEKEIQRNWSYASDEEADEANLMPEDIQKELDEDLESLSESKGKTYNLTERLEKRGTV